jgi:superoxide reductase
MKIYKCSKCGQMVYVLQDSPVTPVCCGVEMEELTANTTDAATEKHVPVITQDGTHVDVVVGSVEHPMIEKHYIQFIAIETAQGVQVKYLKPGEAPKASFELTADDKLVAAYEFCNLHGLWKAEA